MREITKTVSISIDGKPLDFRLTKLDAFSGAALLRMLSSRPSLRFAVYGCLYSGILIRTYSCSSGG